MNVKNVVKVMNFHSLLKVDKARKDAEKYFEVERELREMIASITNNRNYILDKRVLKVDGNKPVLNIYVGSDMGFCGGYNYNVNTAAKVDDKSEKVVIGKKVWKSLDNVKISIPKSEYQANPKLVSDFINTAILKRSYSEVNVLYNNYVNISDIRWVKKRLFPLDLGSREFRSTYKEDFVCESDLDDLLAKMVATYIDYEVQILVKNSLASENIMRQNSTTDSLKKIDELEEKKHYAEYKQKMQKNSQRTIENVVKLKSSKGGF